MKFSNRLTNETSPYLLQHAHNPVDWYAWGPEAFEAARAQNKPIFLSVGYSTCYWCHVMERQSFENETVAAEMNRLFINIKVDREERPDVDQVYMTAVQILTQHGGWPMSVFLLPDLRPFYGGTYFPPTDQHGRPGFVTVLRAIADAYHSRREEVDRSADQIVKILRQTTQPPAPARQMNIDRSFLNELIARSTSDFDPELGGFGSAPKFPRQTLLELLLRFGDDASKKKAIQSLVAMANGGIRDHLGGGFHRYSTDAHWLVPHFEIMLYDNAMLGWCYVEAFRQTRDERLARIARGILDFILRDMTSPEGGFYTALDAEVDAQEGSSYLWTEEQIMEELGAIDGVFFSSVYGADQGPNFADPHHGTGQPDQNILYLPNGPEKENDPRIVAMREKLLKARSTRKQPMLDTKIITSWNALMIRAFAQAANILKEDRYAKAAERAATFLYEKHRQPNGELYRTSRDGATRHSAFLDDYAFFAQAMLVLPGETWRRRAVELAELMIAKFGDAAGGFYFSAADATDLIVRQKVASDSPLPSGNGVAVEVMLDISREEIARKGIEAFAVQLERQGEGMSALLASAVSFIEHIGPIEVASRGQAEADRPLSPAELAQRVVAMRWEWNSPRELKLKLSIMRRFHINSNQPEKGLIATAIRIEGATVESMDYPPGSTWEWKQEIGVRFTEEVIGPLRVAVTYQACNDRECLAPVTRSFDVTPPG